MGKKNGGESSASPGASPPHFDVRQKVLRGHVPMLTGCGERVVVPVRLLRDPCIAELLDMAAQQFGYGQPGVLRIPCDAGRFRRAVDGALHRADYAPGPAGLRREESMSGAACTYAASTV